MKHLKQLFVFVLLAVFGVGQMWAAETQLFSQTFPGSPTSYTNSYTKSFSMTTSGSTLTYANVNNGQESNAWTVVRAGRNNNNASVVTLTSSQISAAVSKVSITFTQVDANLTNELYLEVASNSSFTSATKISANIAASEIEFPITSPAANKYYRIVIDLKAGSSNGFTRFNRVTFFQNSGGTTKPTRFSNHTEIPSNSLIFNTIP